MLLKKEKNRIYFTGIPVCGVENSTREVTDDWKERNMTKLSKDWRAGKIYKIEEESAYFLPEHGNCDKNCIVGTYISETGVLFDYHALYETFLEITPTELKELEVFLYREKKRLEGQLMRLEGLVKAHKLEY